MRTVHLHRAWQAHSTPSRGFLQGCNSAWQHGLHLSEVLEDFGQGLHMMPSPLPKT